MSDNARGKSYAEYAASWDAVDPIANTQAVINYIGSRYETLDSGKRAEFPSGMVRDTEDNKARFDLLYPLAVRFERQLVVRSDVLADEDPDSRVGADDDPEKLYIRYCDDATDGIVKWMLGTPGGDWAALAFGSIVGVAELVWTLENGAAIEEHAPYDEAALTRLALLMARGAVKYDERNWEKGSSAAELKRSYSSALRHWRQFLRRKEDEDHLAATLFNLLGGDYYQQVLEVGFWLPAGNQGILPARPLFQMPAAAPLSDARKLEKLQEYLSADDAQAILRLEKEADGE